MNSRRCTVLSSAMLGASLLGAAPAFAHPPRWDMTPRYVVAPPVAVRYQSDYMYARVVDVEPFMTRVRVDTPQRDCWYEEREVYPQRGIDEVTAGPTVLGAIIGGVVGHQIGSGRGRDAATVAGSVIGASIGHSSAVHAAGTETRDVKRCEVSYQQNWEERVDGYRVTYVYRGREYTTRMAYDPGSKVRIRVPYERDDYGY